MAGTRSSVRQAAAAASVGSNSSQTQPATKSGTAGSKRKGSTATSPKSKRGKKGDKKKQNTIEATMPTEDTEEPSEDVEVKDDMPSEEGIGSASEANKSVGMTGSEDTNNGGEVAKTDNGETKKHKQGEPLKEEKGETEDTKPTNGHVQSTNVEAQHVSETAQDDDTSKIDNTSAVKSGDSTTNGGANAVTKSNDAVEESSEREESTPSSILEKGIIYFFFRGRVNVEEPSAVDDIARSYIVLRPLPHGAKLGDGPIGDSGNNRLLALPKKVLPVSPKDRFMVFVEKSSASMEEIKNDLASSDYMTKTAGSRHTPAAAPIGEGVYAITTTGRESHIAYILTIPSELSEVQQDVGLKERGSFMTSVKNPQYPGPANTNLPKGPEYPPEYAFAIGFSRCRTDKALLRIVEEFRSLRWTPLQPKLLNYVNTQMLIIGHEGNSVEKATVQQDEDQEKHKDTPMEEIEKLEHEDELRVEHLKGMPVLISNLTIRPLLMQAR